MDQEHSLIARQAGTIDGSLGPKREEPKGLPEILSFCGEDERTTHHIIHTVTCVLFGPSRQALGISPHHTFLSELFATPKGAELLMTYLADIPTTQKPSRPPRFPGTPTLRSEMDRHSWDDIIT